MALRRHVILGASCFVLLFLIAGAALAARTYPDRVGDVKGGKGPDIVSVKVTNTRTTVSFGFRFAQAPPLRFSTRERWVDMLLVGIDVPPTGPLPFSPGGEWPGVDFALGTHGPSATGQLVRTPRGPDGRSRLVARFPIVTRGSTVSFTVPRRALGNPAWFTFTVAAAREGEDEAAGRGFDTAPARGTFRYVLTG
jgi:hypothetical protein